MRVRGVAVVVALSVVALHVVAGAATEHSHGEGEVCSVCASFASEDEAVQARSAAALAAQDAGAAAPAARPPLAVRRPLSYSPRGPPTLCR